MWRGGKNLTQWMPGPDGGSREEETESEPTYMPTREAADYLRISYRSLELMRLKSSRKPGPPWCRPGRQIVYRKEDLDAWMLSQREQVGKFLDPQEPKIKPPRQADRLREILDIPRVPRGRAKQTPFPEEIKMAVDTRWRRSRVSRGGFPRWRLPDGFQGARHVIREATGV